MSGAERPGLNFAAVNRYCMSALPTLLARWLPDGRQRHGLWAGARNPTRNDRRGGSFVVWMSRGNWKDFAGDERDKGGDPISLYAYLRGIGMGEALRELAGEFGLDPALPRLGWKADPSAAAPPRKEPDSEAMRQARKRRQQARRIWQQSAPAFGTPVEGYLRGRGITLTVPASIRYARLHHPATGWKASDPAYPCMVALMRTASGFAGIHRTYLTDDGEKASIWDAQAEKDANVKLMLGSSEGAEVRLSPPGACLVTGEGIESSLSALQLSPGWAGRAALSAGNLPALTLPEGTIRHRFVADGDHKFDERLMNYRSVGLSRAQAASDALTALGIESDVVYPGHDADLNDILEGDLERARLFEAMQTAALAEALGQREEAA